MKAATQEEDFTIYARPISLVVGDQLQQTLEWAKSMHQAAQKYVEDEQAEAAKRAAELNPEKLIESL